MDKLQEAIKYLELNTSLSFHHAAIKFGVNVSKLQNAWAERKRVKNA